MLGILLIDMEARLSCKEIEAKRALIFTTSGKQLNVFERRVLEEFRMSRTY